MSAADMILERLTKVRKTGPGRWAACCPAHEDRSPSLSVRDVDGRVLVHCFGGCSASDVVDSLGLTLSDLFDQPLGNFDTVKAKIPASDVLSLLSHEAYVAAIITDFAAREGGLSDVAANRLAQAAGRLGAARSYVRG